jgi:hypothetical protein
MADVRVLGFWKQWTQKIVSLKSESHTTTSKYPEAASIIQQACKVLRDNEYIVGCSLAKVEESSECTSIVNNAEEK